MRNVWKGMVVGALTGAATGLALDLGERGAAKAAALSGLGAAKAAELHGAAVDHAPLFVDHVRHVVSDAVASAADHVSASDVPTRAKSAVSAAQEKVATAATEGRGLAGDVAAQGKDLLVGSLGQVRQGAEHS